MKCPCIWNPPRGWCPNFGKCDPATALACFMKEKVAYFPFTASRLTEEGEGVLREEFERKLKEAKGEL